MAEIGQNAARRRGGFISFEGTEGGGKSTQIELLTQRLRSEGFSVRAIREPGGTPIGEEIRQTLKHSPHNHSMTAEAELLLMNASRAQLVREVIRPALAAGEIIVCDRFADSTIAYQGYGRGLNAEQVRDMIHFAVGDTWPDLTLLLSVRGCRPASRCAIGLRKWIENSSAEWRTVFDRSRRVVLRE
jgi:dTMP kinase